MRWTLSGGNFTGDSWREWNDRFRDDIRDFFRAPRIPQIGSRSSAGQPGHLWPEDRELEESINFVTCHDGFTLNDSFLITTSTMKRTARATATGVRITEAGTAESKARRSILESRPCGTGRSKTF